jgi:hypothetical protein
MAGQMPPDVLEDLMLFEAIDGPGGVAPGAMPGGFGDMQAEMGAEEAVDEGANVVNVNFVPALLPGTARPRVELGQGVGDVEEDDEDTDEGEEEEEEYISVRMLTFVL